MSKYLTDKQRAFINEYLVDFNATQAAKRAGYQGDNASLAVIGFQNLRKHKIREAIENYLGEQSMGFEEIMYHLTRQARGSIRDFISLGEDDNWVFDVRKAIDSGAIDFVENIIFHGSRGADGSVKRSLHIKLYSAQRALIQLGKAYGLWQGKLRQMKVLEDGKAIYSPPLAGTTGVQPVKPGYSKPVEESELFQEINEMDPTMSTNEIFDELERRGHDVEGARTIYRNFEESLVRRLPGTMPGNSK